REVLAALAQEDEARSRAARSSAGAIRRTARSDSVRVMERAGPSEPASRRGQGSASARRMRDTDEAPPPVEGIETWMIWAGIGLLIAIVFVIILLIAWKRDAARAVSIKSTKRQPGIAVTSFNHTYSDRGRLDSATRGALLLAANGHRLCWPSPSAFPQVQRKS